MTDHITASQAIGERLRAVLVFMFAALVGVLLALIAGTITVKAIAHTAHDLHGTTCTAPSCF